MGSPYKAMYEERLNFDPFSCRTAIDCKTPLEDIFGAFLGEMIEKIGGFHTVYNHTDKVNYNWEVNYIYMPSIKDSRNAQQNYSPNMILAQEELDNLLGRPLYTFTASDMDVAKTITKRFSDITMTLDGLIKLSRRMLDPDEKWKKAPVKNPDCNANCPDSVLAIEDMISAIREVRNPSAHRGMQTSAVPIELICKNARIAYDKIVNALPHLPKVFNLYTNADVQYLRDRYCPLLNRFLNDLEKKINNGDIDLTNPQIHYTDLTNYSIFLDESALSSGFTVTLNKLADEMRVFIFEDSLSSVAKSTANPDAMTRMVAKNSLTTFYMAKKNVKFIKNRKENDQQSILDVLQNNPDSRIFVVTESRSFAEKIIALGNPRHIAAQICNNRGQFIIYRSECSDE